MMTSRSDRITADDWADEYLTRLQRSRDRRARLARERFKPDPDVLAVRSYDEKTEQLTRYLRVERERKEVA